MKSRPASYPCKRVNSKVVLVCSLAIVVAALSLSVAVWRTLPAAARNPSPPRPMPAGQFQADARTLLAALNYLLERDATQGWAAPTATTVTGELAVQPLAYSPVAVYSVSNQAQSFFEPATNLPARS